MREAANRATPGPWGWFGDRRGEMHLSTVKWGRVIIMGFARLGMSNAQPKFQTYTERESNDPNRWRGHLVNGKDIAILAASYRDDIIGFDNSDATWMALMSPDTVSPLLDIADAAEAYMICLDKMHRVPPESYGTDILDPNRDAAERALRTVLEGRGPTGAGDSREGKS